MLNTHFIKIIKHILETIALNFLKIVEFILDFYHNKQRNKYEYLKHQEIEQNKKEFFVIEHEYQAQQRKLERINQQAATKPVLILESIKKENVTNQDFFIPIKLTNIGHPALNVSLFRCYNNKYFEFSDKNVELHINAYLNTSSLNKNCSTTFIIRVVGDEKTDYNKVNFTVCFYDIMGRKYIQEFSFFYYPNCDSFYQQIYSDPPICIEDIISD